MHKSRKWVVLRAVTLRGDVEEGGEMGIALPPVIQTKPAFGLPCNGCGLCCAEEVCGIGKMVHGEIDGPCPSLVLIGELYRCGLVMAEAIGNLPPLISDALAIGKGCDSEDLN